MGRKKKTDRQIDEVQKERDAKIYQADALLQKGRFELYVTEWRLIFYAVSKIKSTDTKFQEYTFKLMKFYDICGIKVLDSYTAIKKIMLDLRKKVWWMTMEDPNEPGTECESAVSWFEIVRTNKKTGTVTIAFHPDMMPYFLELARRSEEGDGYYTQSIFRYILPMKSQYAVRLYWLLKSYEKNNERWWFKLDNLKRLLNCRNYTRYADFRLRVLEPAIKEINKYSDIKIDYETEKDGYRIDIIEFRMVKKNTDEHLDALRAGMTELDGNVHWWDSEVLPGQMDFLGFEHEND